MAPAAAVFALDRLTKWIIETRVSFFDTYRVIPGFFDIVRSQNRGVAFGIFNDSTSEWRTIAADRRSRWRRWSAIGVMLWNARRLDRYSVLGLRADSGRRGGQCVRPHRVGAGDGLSATSMSAQYHWPTFNVADSAIVIGSGLLLLDLLQARNGRRANVS